MTIHTLMNVYTVVVSIIVLWFTICTLNLMTYKTRNLIRLAHVLIGVGAFATLLAPSFLSRPLTGIELLLLTGMAIMTLADRRRKGRRHGLLTG